MNNQSKMNQWRNLFIDGEYEPREKILSRLTLEQVKRTPSAQSHSIYEELWHADRWQTIIVERDEALYETWQRGERYPVKPPERGRMVSPRGGVSPGSGEGSCVGRVARETERGS